MSDWQECLLGDLIELKRGYDLPKKDRIEGSYPIVSSSGVTGNHNEAKVKGPGVVTGRYGTLGEVFYIPDNFWPLNTSLYVRDFKGNDPRFVSFFLQSLDLGRSNAAGAVPGVNRNHLHQLEVLSPPLPIQRRIASILSTYDDLIENNTRRIAILEEMARRLYEEWFVHFRFPGHEDTTFTETENGRVPEGWESKTLGAVVKIKKGKNITKKTIIPGNVPVVAGGLSPAYYHNASNTKEPVVTVSASGANAGFVKLYQQDIWTSDCSYIDGLATPHVHFFYLLLKYHQNDVTRMQKGSAQPHVYPVDLMKLAVIEAPSEVMEQFQALVGPQFALIKNLDKRNANLRAQRDLLLPKLISGEIDVSEAEDKIEEVA